MSIEKAAFGPPSFTVFWKSRHVVLDEDLDREDVHLVERDRERLTELLKTIRGAGVLVRDHVVRMGLGELRHGVGDRGSEDRGDGEGLVHRDDPLFVDGNIISDSDEDVNQKSAEP